MCFSAFCSASPRLRGEFSPTICGGNLLADELQIVTDRGQLVLRLVAHLDCDRSHEAGARKILGGNALKLYKLD